MTRLICYLSHCKDGKWLLQFLFAFKLKRKPEVEGVGKSSNIKLTEELENNFKMSKYFYGLTLHFI